MSIIQEQKWSECSECGNSKGVIQEEIYGCDACGTEITSPHHEECNYHQITVFYHDSEREAKRLHFCCFECVFKSLQGLQRLKEEAEDIHFIKLPFLKLENDDLNKFFTSMKEINNEA